MSAPSKPEQQAARTHKCVPSQLVLFKTFRLVAFGVYRRSSAEVSHLSPVIYIRKVFRPSWLFYILQ